MSTLPRLTLVRLINGHSYKIAYQFFDEDNSAVSPAFTGEMKAGEWYQRYIASFYEGEERRERFIDRRDPDANRVSRGRRFADQETRYVDSARWLELDLARVKSDTETL